MKNRTETVLLGFFAFIMGMAFTGSINPFIIPFYVAAYIQGGNIIVLMITGLLGMAVNFNFYAAVKYGVIMIAAGLIIGTKDKALLVKQRVIWALVLAGIIFAADVVIKLFDADTEISWIEIGAETLLAFSLTIIYYKAFRVIKNDFVKIVIDNEAAISILVLASTLLYGLPTEIAGFRIAETAGVYFLLYAVYRFGIGIGSTWAACAGMILGFKTEMGEYLVFMLAAAVVCTAVSGLIPYKKVAISVSFVALSVVMGMEYWEYILGESGLKAFVSALIVFILTPTSIMMYVDERIRRGEVFEASSEWGRLMIDRVKNFAGAFRRIEYTFAGNDGLGISFREIGDVLEGFTTEFEDAVPMKKTLEADIISDLSKKNAVVKSLLLTKDKEGKYQIYITAKMARGRLLTANEIKEAVELRLKMPLHIMPESRNVVGKNFTLIALEEEPPFYCRFAAKRVSKYESSMSGDNFSLCEINNGQLLMLLADGMGSGEKASAESEKVISTLEDLLEAGFDTELSVKFVNSYISRRNKGEIFTTLDMLLLDCYTGCGRLYKQGAAATFIRRGDWIEVIKSTSLPVGISEDAECEKSVKKFYENDIIVMVSDGVIEGIVFENKEDYLKSIIMNVDSNDAEEIAEEIITDIKNLNGKNLKDDATVLVAVVMKN